APITSNIATLLPLALQLLLIGKIGVQLDLQSERSRLLCEIRQIKVFMNSLADVARHSQFKCIFGHLLHLFSTLILTSSALAGRGNDVITQPRMLLDIAHDISL